MSAPTCTSAAVMVFEPRPTAARPGRRRSRADLECAGSARCLATGSGSRSRTPAACLAELGRRPDFDIAATRAPRGASRPGRRRGAPRVGREFFSERLDRSRPLWELVLLEGLADGRWAMATKTHHCMVDGVGSVDIDAPDARLRARSARRRAGPVGPPRGRPRRATAAVRVGGAGGRSVRRVGVAAAPPGAASAGRSRRGIDPHPAAPGRRLSAPGAGRVARS